MAIIKITATDRGCNNANYIETFIDDVKHWPTSGNFMYPCSMTHAAFIDDTYIDQFKLPSNTIYLNNSLYWQDSGTQRYGCVNNVCTPQANGQYTESTCAGNCQSLPPDNNNSLVLLAGLAIAAAGVIYYFKQQQKKNAIAEE